MASPEPLTPPFDNPQEAFRSLIASLDDPDREKIMVGRLEATFALRPPSLKEICTLALLVPSYARFDPSSLPTREGDPRELGQKMGPVSELIDQHLTALEKLHENREERVFSAFPGSDPRRLLKDTILGFAAAELSDVSQKLGEADPFSRLALRLSLWFKPWLDHSRYGISLPHGGGRTIVSAVGRALKEYFDEARIKKFSRLIAIWSGERYVDASREGLLEVASLPSIFDNFDVDGLDGILALEIYGALADELDDLDIETLEAFSECWNLMSSKLSDGRPCTANFHAWLENQVKADEMFLLAYDSSQAFSSAMFSHNVGTLKTLLTATLDAITQRGHTMFAAGPLPIRGTILGRKSDLFETLSERSPEAADLIRLFGIDGDYKDLNGPYPIQSLWTGDFDSHAIIFPEAIDRAHQRGDHALCDMLIGCWLLHCMLFAQLPLPDVVGVARRITALPVDHRSSTYAALGVLKREAAAHPRSRRDLDALLSWLPLVDVAPAEDFSAYLEDLFTPRLWKLLNREECQRLIKAEESFVNIRRRSHSERREEILRILVIDWSAVAERVLSRLSKSLNGPSAKSGQSLGILIDEMVGTQKRLRNEGNKDGKHLPRHFGHALEVLSQLNAVTKKGATHLGGITVSWEDVIQIHAGLYGALKVLLDATNTQTGGTKTESN